ncbi:uncharacterized protein LOC106663083 isoform X2 [Cimex lectularius]|nr:uncharacterized protein LOC106663083 isoform X2 [Cimex lectularius]
MSLAFGETGKWETVEDVLYSLDCVSVMKKPDPRVIRRPNTAAKKASPIVVPRHTGIGRGVLIREIENEYGVGFRDSFLHSELRQAHACDFSNESIEANWAPEVVKERGIWVEREPKTNIGGFESNGWSVPDRFEDAPSQQPPSQQDSAKLRSLYSSVVRLKNRNALIAGLNKSHDSRRPFS